MRLLKDIFARKTMFLLTLVPSAPRPAHHLRALSEVPGRSWGSNPSGRSSSRTTWAPLKGEFGFLPFIMGTLWVTAVALVIALPISLFTAIYLSEYAPQVFRNFAKPVIDLLAGIPSVVFGVWGIMVIVPFVGNVLAPLFGVVFQRLQHPGRRHRPGHHDLPDHHPRLARGLRLHPRRPARDLALPRRDALGDGPATSSCGRAPRGSWPPSSSGLSRAFGETMAVLMVVGQRPPVPKSLFDPGYPLPALIANNYGEMMSIPLYDSALMLAALVLLVVVLVVSVLGRWILVKAERRAE